MDVRPEGTIALIDPSHRRNMYKITNKSCSYKVYKVIPWLTAHDIKVEVQKDDDFDERSFSQ